MGQRESLPSKAGDDVTAKGIVRDLKSVDVSTQLRGVGLARRLLRAEEPALARVLAAGVIAPLVDALDRHDCPDLQHQALDALTSVAFQSREHTMAVVNSGVISKLVTFLEHGSDLADRAILMLGSFCLHGPAADAVLARGAVRAMLPHLRTDTPVRRLRTFVRAYSNLCSHNNGKKKIKHLSLALPSIYELLDMKDVETPDDEDEESPDDEDEESPEIDEGKYEESKDSPSQQKYIHVPHTASDIVEVACTALTNIMHGPDEVGQIKGIMAVQSVPGLTARLAELLGHEAAAVRMAALGAVGNMLAGTDAQIDGCIEANCLERILPLLQCSEASLVKEAARAAGNILAGTTRQIQRALDTDILTPLRNILAKEQPECQMQAASAITNLSQRGSAVQRARLVLSGALRPYCALLAAENRALAGEVLHGLHALLKAAERDRNVKPLCYVLDELDVLDHMQLLLERVTHKNQRRKIRDVSRTLRRCAYEERSVSHDGKMFTSKDIVQDLESPHLATKTRAARAVCRLLQEQHPPRNALVEAGVVTSLVYALDESVDFNLQYEMVWALSIITAGTQKHKKAVVDSGAIPKLLRFLSREEKTAELAARSLGCMALFSRLETRNAVLAFIGSDPGSAELRTYVRSFNNLCSQLREEPAEVMRVSPTLPFISELLETGDQIILEVACCALSNMMCGPSECVEAVQTVPGLMARLVHLLGHEEASVKESALNAIGNILLGTDIQINRCLDANCLDHIVPLLQSSPSLVKQAARATGNILAGTHAQIQRALEKDILTPLRNILANENEECHKEAVRAITNLSQRGSAVQRARLVLSGALRPYCALLAAENRALAGEVLHGLHALLQVEKDSELKHLCMKLNELGVVDLLRQLQNHEMDKDISHKAVVLSVIIRQQARGEHLIIEDGKVFDPAEIVLDLESKDQVTYARAVRAARRMLEEGHPPAAAMVEAGIIAPLVMALENDDCSNKYEAVRMLCKITESRKLARAVVKGRAIPKLVKLLHPWNETTKPAIQTLIYISLSYDLRDSVLAHRVVPVILPYMRRETPENQFELVMAFYFSLCMCLSAIHVELVTPALPYLLEILHVKNDPILSLTCACLTNIMDGPQELGVNAIRAVPGLKARLVALLDHEATAVKDQACIALGNMISGVSTQIIKEQIPDNLRAFETDDRFLEELDQELRALKKEVLVPLLNILNKNENDFDLQSSVLRTLCTITTDIDDHTMSMVDSGIISKLVDLLSVGGEVTECAFYNLKHISLHGPETRSLVLANGLVPAILPHLHINTPMPMELLKTYALGLIELCCHDDNGPSKFKLEQMLPVLPVISNLLVIKDKEILEKLCYVLTNLTSGPNERKEAIQAVPELMNRIVALLSHSDTNVQTLATSVIANMFCGTDAQAERLLSTNCLKSIISLLRSSKPSVLSEATRAVANILSREPPHIELALEKGILLPLKTILTNGEPEIKKYVATGITKLCFKGTATQIDKVASSNVLEPYCAILAAPEHNVKDVEKLFPYITTYTPPPKQTLNEGCDYLDLDHFELTQNKELSAAAWVMTGLWKMMQVATENGNGKSLAVKLVKMDILNRLQIYLEYETDEDLRLRAENLMAAIMLNFGGNNKHCIAVKIYDRVFTLADVVEDLKSKDLKRKELAAYILRTMLSVKSEIGSRIVEEGAMGPLVDALDRHECSSLQFEATWTLTNLTNGHAIAIANAGAIPKLVALLPKGGEIAMTVAVALGNISNHGPRMRDLVLAHGTVSAMQPYMQLDTPLELLRAFVQAYFYFCRYDEEYPMVKIELVSPALPNIFELLASDDDQILQHAIYALVQIINTQEQIEMVQSIPKATSRIMALLQHKRLEMDIKFAVLNTVTTMNRTDVQVGRCLDAGCLDHIAFFLQSRDIAFVALAVATVTNILHSTPSHIQRVLDKGILTLLPNVLAHKEPQCHKLAMFAIYNLCNMGTAEQACRVVSSGVLEPYCAILTSVEASQLDFMAGSILCGLNSLLLAAVKDSKIKILCMELKEIGLLEQMEKLQHREVSENLSLEIKNISEILYELDREEDLEVQDKKKLTLADILQDLRSQDLETQSRAMRVATRVLSDENPPKTHLVQIGIIESLVEDLDSLGLQFEAVRALAKITTTRDYRKAIVDSGAIPKLVCLLSHDVTVADQAALALGNIAEEGLETRDLALAQADPAKNIAEEGLETRDLTLAQAAPAKSIVEEGPKMRVPVMAQAAPTTNIADDGLETRDLVMTQAAPAKNIVEDGPEARDLVLPQATTSKNIAEDRPETRDLVMTQAAPATNIIEEGPETRDLVLSHAAPTTNIAEDGLEIKDLALAQADPATLHQRPGEPERLLNVDSGLQSYKSFCRHDDKTSDKPENVSLNSRPLSQTSELLNTEDADVSGEGES